jgi:amidohydrolase
VNTEQLKQAVSEALAALDTDVLALSDYIHAHPELGHQEFQAVDVLCRFLTERGFTVEKGVGGFPTAFKATLRGQAARPAVAFIAEYDALPELGHACGHNLIAAAAAAAGAAFAGLTAGLPGTVQVIGTPAEEVPPPVKGAMAAAGVFADTDVAMIIHGGDRTCTGAHSLAVQGVEFRFTGRPAHAAKCPEEGISALDSVLLTMHAVEMLREHVLPDVRMHGIITDGGSRPNVVPETAAVKYMVRSADTKYVDVVMDKVITCARAGALAFGAGLEVVTGDKVDAKLLVPSLDRLLQENARAAGARNIMEPDKSVGSTDFGNLSQVVPASTLKVAVKDPGMSGQVHTREFCTAAGGPSGQKAVRFGARAMAWTACELLTRPELLAQVKSEFQALRG